MRASSWPVCGMLMTKFLVRHGEFNPKALETRGKVSSSCHSEGKHPEHSIRGCDVNHSFRTSNARWRTIPQFHPSVPYSENGGDWSQHEWR